MTDSDVARIVASKMTVADKIRALDKAGYARAEIARLLNKRYQHVRNVLEGDRLHRPSPAGGGLAEEGPPFRHAREPDPARQGEDVQARGGGLFRLKVREDGSVVLPHEVREAFDLANGGAVMARLEGEEFKLISAATALRRAQEMVRRYVPDDVSLVDELLADRRREAEREERE